MICIIFTDSPGVNVKVKYTFTLSSSFLTGETSEDGDCVLHTEQVGGVPLLPSPLLPPLPHLPHLPHHGLWRGGGAAAEEVTEVVPEDFAAETVDEGVVAAVAHGQPMEDEEDHVDELETEK